MKVDGGRTASRGGQRPRDRKAQVIAAATRRFSRHGYHSVSMEDIAGDLGITAGALYRHFRSKQELLARSITDGLQIVATATTSLADPDQLLPTLSTLALDHRGLPVLWQREIRALSAEQREASRGVLLHIADNLRVAVRGRRPELGAGSAELLAWSLIAVFASPSYHTITLARSHFDRILFDVAKAVLSTPMEDLPEPEHAGPPVAAAPLGRTSTRERLLTAAIALFSERGYSAVGLRDIGKRTGISGPSIYKYFNSKSDLLVAALRRGAESLSLQLSQALTTATGPGHAIDLVFRSYIELATAQPEVVGVLVTEVDSLPGDIRDAIRRTHRDYIVELAALLTAHQPALEPDIARVKVQAALTVINDVIRVRHLRQRARIRDDLVAVTRQILGTAAPGA